MSISNNALTALSNHDMTASALWRNHIDPHFRQLAQVQDAFEILRGQFGNSTRSEKEWRQAADVLDRAYDACVAQENSARVFELFALATEQINIALEKSLPAQSDNISSIQS